MFVTVHFVLAVLNSRESDTYVAVRVQMCPAGRLSRTYSKFTVCKLCSYLYFGEMEQTG